MQAEMMYRDTMSHQVKQEVRDPRETIHSGHFMVSDFEAEAQDDEDELAVPVPEEEAARLAIIAPPGFSLEKFVASSTTDKNSQQLSIETSLNKLFQCMSLAYRWARIFYSFLFENKSLFMRLFFVIFNVYIHGFLCYIGFKLEALINSKYIYSTVSRGLPRLFVI